MLHKLISSGLIAVAVIASAQSASAATIVINTAGGGQLAIATFAGQSVTTPGGSSWTDIQFAFLNGVTPYAEGDLFLLTSEYLGAPSGLSAATPGFLAMSTGIVGGMWVFPSAVSLAPSTMYWFYSNAQFSPGDFTGGGDVYPGGQFYVNWPGGGGPNDAFQARADEDADFLLTGNQAQPVPEPGTLVLIGTGIAIARARGWRRNGLPRS